MGAAKPQLAAQTRADREIVLDLSTHPKHDKAPCFLKGESHIVWVTSKTLKQQSMSQAHTHTRTEMQTFIFLKTAMPPPTVTQSKSAEWLASPPIPTLLATEHVLINKAMQRENAERERGSESEKAAGYN